MSNDAELEREYQRLVLTPRSKLSPEDQAKRDHIIQRVNRERSLEAVEADAEMAEMEMQSRIDEAHAMAEIDAKITAGTWHPDEETGTRRFRRGRRRGKQ